MTIQQLDYWFPFIVFGYGVMMSVMLYHPKVVRLSQERLPQEMLMSFQAKKPLAILCLTVGALWALQNIWLG